MRRLLIPLALLVASAPLVAGCDNDDAPSAAVVPEADVERLRIRLFEATIPLDAEIAAVEADAAAASDTLVQAAYAPVLARLHDARRRLQARMDSLRPMPRAAFDSTAAQAERAAADLRAAVARARLDATPTAEALRVAVDADLARLDGRLAAARDRADADTTGRQTALLDSLSADRARLVERLRAYPDTSEAMFERFRERAIADALALRARADRLAPDSTATGFRRTPQASTPR